MTLRNDGNNWMVVVLSNPEGEFVLVTVNQAENVARAAAENYANQHPGVAVSVYKREGTVQTVPTAKWE